MHSCWDIAERQFFVRFSSSAFVSAGKHLLIVGRLIFAFGVYFADSIAILRFVLK